MRLTIDLPPELEQRLTQEAERRGLAVDAYALRLIEGAVPPTERGAEVAKLLQSWVDEADAQEQRETGEYLIRALDADRLSDRTLFPPELRGGTW